MEFLYVLSEVSYLFREILVSPRTQPKDLDIIKVTLD